MMCLDVEGCARGNSKEENAQNYKKNFNKHDGDRASCQTQLEVTLIISHTSLHVPAPRRALVQPGHAFGRGGKVMAPISFSSKTLKLTLNHSNSSTWVAGRRRRTPDGVA